MENEVNLTWGREAHDLLERWPKLPDGTPETPAFLTTAAEAGGQADLLIEMLRSYQIPVIKKYAHEGALGKVVLGFSGYGADLYVPESMLEDARNLMQPADAAEEEEKA